MSIVIRTARRDDASSIVEVAVRSIHSLGSAFYDAEQIDVWSGAFTIDRVHEMFITGITWVAEIDAQLVGFARWEPPEEFDLLYVHPEHARTGVAGLLTGALERTATESGSHQLEATVSRSARSAFDSFGYELVEEFDKELDGQRFPVARMRKSLL